MPPELRLKCWRFLCCCCCSCCCWRRWQQGDNV